MKPIHPAHSFIAMGVIFDFQWLYHCLILRQTWFVEGSRVKAATSSLLMRSEHLRACAVSRMLTCAGMLTIRNKHKSYHKHHVMGESDIWWNYEHLHRVCMCWSMCCCAILLIKKHDDEKSGVCANCYKAKSDQSVTQCRQVLGDKCSNALMTEPLVVPNCSEEENVQRCISSGFTPCCAELVSFSAIRAFHAHTATTKGPGGMMTMVWDT